MSAVLQANWQALGDTDIISLLRNSEGRNSTERALFLEAARRIEAQQAAIAAAVQAEREACAVMGDQLAGYFDQHPGIKDKAAAESCRNYAAAIRARSNGNGSK